MPINVVIEKDGCVLLVGLFLLMKSMDLMGLFCRILMGFLLDLVMPIV